MIRFIFSAAALGVAVALFFMYTKPTYDSVNGVKERIAQYNQALGKAAELQQLKQTLLSRYNAFNPLDIARLKKLLPDHVDNVRLILDLDNLAGRHKMAVQNVAIGGASSETGEGTAAGTIGAAREKVDSLTLKFSTRATYPAFMAFLQELESSLRITDVIALTLTPETTESGKEPTYRYDITIRTYWLK